MVEALVYEVRLVRPSSANISHCQKYSKTRGYVEEERKQQDFGRSCRNVKATL
jgi:hypothetical protein